MKQRILTLILIMSIVLSITTVHVNAAKKGECGENLKWSIDAKGVLIVSGSGDMNDYDIIGKTAPVPPWNDSSYLIRKVKIEEGVTYIGSNAFADCKNLLEVEFPESLIEIGNSAFMFTNLSIVVIPDSVKKIDTNCFYNCVNLKELCIGKKVEHIGDYSFFNCKELSSITIPGSVNYIGNSAFGECSIDAIIYEGSKDQWDGINKGVAWDDGLYKSGEAIINYSVNGTVTDYTSYDPHSINVLIDGDYIKFDVKPQVINGRTLVPMRKIFEELGATVDWNDSTQTAIGTKENTTVQFTIDDYTMYKNGVSSKLDVPAQLINGRTLIPIRAVSEAFNCQVGWDGNTNTVSIIDDPTKYTMLYAPNDRSKSFLTKNISNQLKDGWYTEPVQVLYKVGESAVFKKTEVETQLKNGWETEYVKIMYSPEGKTKLVKKSEIEANKKVGWYTEPVQRLYAPGKSAVFKMTEVAEQLTVGWYTEPVQRLYAPGKSAVFKQSEVEAQLSVGWHTEPIITMYAPDGRTKNIVNSEVEAYKKVGWYTNQKNAIASKYPKHNIRVFRINANSNSVGGIEPSIIWRNDSGKTIKYIYFTCVPYNAVGDIVSCRISGETYARLQATGPYATFSQNDLNSYPWTYHKGMPVVVNKDESSSRYYVQNKKEENYLTEEDYKHVYNFENSWDPIWYNYSIEMIKITQINVTYMDGTSETISNPPIWREVFRNAGI